MELRYVEYLKEEDLSSFVALEKYNSSRNNLIVEINYVLLDLKRKELEFDLWQYFYYFFTYRSRYSLFLFFYVISPLLLCEPLDFC